VIFVLGGLIAQAGAALVGAAGSAVLALVRPGVKQMKGVGLSLAGISAIAALALLVL
jgi:hypothetical protein